jgi:hypothetical protein
MSIEKFLKDLDLGTGAPFRAIATGEVERHLRNLALALQKELDSMKGIVR